MALAALTALALSASAPAAQPVLSDTFNCSVATPCGAATSWNPQRLAVNDESGAVYVLDDSNKAIQVFDRDGAWQQAISLSTATFEGDDDIAVDNSGGSHAGWIYVVTGFSDFRAFEPDGTPDWTVATPFGGEPCGVAVKANGDLYGSSYGGGVQKLNPDSGAAEGSPIVPGTGAGAITDTCEIDFDSTDNLYLRGYDVRSIRKLLAPSYATPGTVLYALENFDAAVDRTTDRGYLIQNLNLRWFEANGIEPDDSPASPTQVTGRLGVTVNSSTGRIYVSNNSTDEVEIFDLPSVSLSVTLSPGGTGTGTVTCEVNGGAAEPCAAEYPERTEITLTATPDTGSSLTSLGGAGSASSCSVSPCSFTMGSENEVFVTFDLDTYPLTVSTGGSGAGTVSCDGGACAAEYPYGSEVTLEANPASGSSFAGWSGDCAGAGDCNLTIEGPAEATATFTADPPPATTTPPVTTTPPTTTTPPITTPVTRTPAKATYGSCVKQANKAAQKARKAAKRKKGKARAKAIKGANKRRAKAVSKCKRRFGKRSTKRHHKRGKRHGNRR